MRKKLVSEESTTSVTERQSEEMTDTSDKPAKEEQVESSKWKPAIEKKSSDASKVSSSNDKDNEVRFSTDFAGFLENGRR